MMRMTMYRYNVALIILLSLFVAGCASKNPNLVTDEEKRAAQNLEIVKRVGELQNVTIQANRDMQVSDADADVIVGWTTKTNRTLATNPPNGWQVVVKSGWDVAKVRVQKYPNLAVYIPIIDNLLPK